MLPLSILGAVFILLWGLKHCPAFTLLVIAALGFAHAQGVRVLPVAVTAPIAQADTSVNTWQYQQTSKLACRQGILTAVTSEDSQQMAAADSSC